MADTPRQETTDASGRDPSYVVVARRYRPKNFEELVGQEHVGRALSNAIETGRVGHAYLFTGARGVGKTSTARIFAKALNNPEGPSATFDNSNDVAQAIDTGEDIDVIEIDGASNRGIDEIRSLRANVGVRPSRSRYKIYIIDEVHMLTQAAFNALLKTLEEPPEHVKFIFCTTDPEKMPITVLSRCQRFDFAPVEVPKIVGRLRQIVDAEHARADDAALELIARRAAGSMRDSQSLLEQVLSFSDGHLTADQVHAMLGTADDERLHQLAVAMSERDAAKALAQLDAAIDAGVDAGRIAEQLLGYFRDLMAVTVGCDPSLQRHTAASMNDELKTLGERWGLQTVLAVVALVDQTLVRIRHSVYGRVLLESTLIQICNLPDLQAIADLAAAASSGNPATVRTAAATQNSAVQKKKPPSDSVAAVESPQGAPASAATDAAQEPPTAANSARANTDPLGDTPSSTLPDSASLQTPAAPTGSPPATNEIAAEAPPATPAPELRLELNDRNLARIIGEAIKHVQQMTASIVSMAQAKVESDSRVTLVFPAEASMAMKRMDMPEHRGPMAEALTAIVGRPISINLAAGPPKQAINRVATPAPKATAKERMERMRQIESHPWIQTCVETFGAEIVKVEPKS